MRRARPERHRLAAKVVLLSLSLAAGASVGCEAVLGTGSLSEEPGTGTPDATRGDDDDDDRSDAHTTPPTSGPEAGPTGDDGPGPGPGDDDTEGGPVVNPSPNPSCHVSDVATFCGASGSDDCCASTLVGDAVGTQTTYDRTYDNDAGITGDPATVTAFRLDTYEVTVGRFREYVKWLESPVGGPPAAGQGMHTYLPGGGLASADLPDEEIELGWQDDWDTSLTYGASAGSIFAATSSCATTYTASVGPNELLPMSCVSWYDAYAFCIWDKGFLPSEAEWELAAAGGTDQRLYPWGDAAPTQAYATFDCAAGQDCRTEVGATSLGAARWGQFDMMGNVAEWVVDQFDDAYSTPCTDCAQMDDETTVRIDRGGAFPDTLTGPYLYPTGRGSFDATGKKDIVGVRCARAPD